MDSPLRGIEPQATAPSVSTADSQSATPPTGALEPTPRPSHTVSKFGSLIGTYEILQELAVGGMGVVYKARHRTDGTIVALKTMRPDLATNPVQAQRFHHEILAVARLHHENIVPILDIGWHDGKPYYTMPLYLGGNLTKLRGNPMVDVNKLIAVIEKVARGVHHAHEQKVWHRDLKPANILLDENDKPAVADFGLAKVHDTDPELTEAGAVMGTWPYMAPEQASGRTYEFGPATDVWALGVILYELLAGQKPFQGKDPNEMREAIRTATPPRLRTLRPDLPSELETIVNRCLQKAPTRRYASAQALADDLRDWQNGGLAVRSKRKRWIAVLAVGLLVIAGIGVAIAIPFRLPFNNDHVENKKDPNDIGDKKPETRDNGSLDKKGNANEMVLVGKSGPPSNYRWVAGEEHGTLVKAAAGDAFTLRSSQYSLMELLPAPPWPHYRLEAKVLHRNSDAGRVGIYVGRVRLNQNQQLKHIFWALHFAELGRESGHRRLVIGRLGNSFVSAPMFNRNERFASEKDQERTIAIEVDGDGLRAYCDKVLVAELDSKAAKNAVSGAYVSSSDGARPDALHTGGLGLFVHDSEASFRDVQISKTGAR